MRGVFTAGVLDAFMKHEIYFRHVVAVSAGAGNGLSYMSRQPRRAHVCNIDLLTKYDYRISDLQDEIAKYEKVYQTNNQRLHELRADSSAMARVGRERYFMKTDDEDVFVLSNDENPDNNPAFYETIK